MLLDSISAAGERAQRIFVGVSRFGSAGADLYRSDDAECERRKLVRAPHEINRHKHLSAESGF